MVEAAMNPSPNQALFRSPFGEQQAGDFHNSQGQLGVKITAGRCPCVTLISTWNSGAPALEAALGTALSVAIPQRSGQTVQTELGLLLRTGPLEFWLVADEPSDRVVLLRQTITPEVGSVTDLSHARCKISITGPKCHAVLSKLFVLDLREREFHISEVRMTGTHHVPSTLHRTGTDSFDLYVFTTYAQDQLETLLDAALEYGVGLRVAD